MIVLFNFLLAYVNAQLHFVSLGNFGTGSRAQLNVAKSLTTWSNQLNISFIVSPGSNFIDPPIQSTTDILWNKRFYDVYNSKNLKIPFYTVLGEQDWKGNITAYTSKSEHNSSTKQNFPIWMLPNYWYHTFFHFKDSSKSSLVEGSSDSSIGFLFVDTFIISQSFDHEHITEQQWNYIRDVLKLMSRVFDWVVVVSDQAMLSSGKSGNNKYLYKTLGRFFNDNHVNLYISGNDHSMEVIQDGEMTFVNCGSGGVADGKNTTTVEGSKFFSTKNGFCHHIVYKDKLVTEFVDGTTGTVLYHHTQEKRKKTFSSIGSRFLDASKLPKVLLVEIPELIKHAAYEAPSKENFVHVVGTIGLMAVGMLLLFLINVKLHKLRK